jgi:hypothetical protein
MFQPFIKKKIRMWTNYRAEYGDTHTHISQLSISNLRLYSLIWLFTVYLTAFLASLIINDEMERM